MLEKLSETWEKCDDGSGRVYFYNVSTGDSQYERPGSSIVPTAKVLRGLPRPASARAAGEATASFEATSYVQGTTNPMHLDRKSSTLGLE